MRPRTHEPNSVKSSPIYNVFLLEHSLVNLQLNAKTPPHLAHVACETLMSAKQANNDKLQGSVDAYFEVWRVC